MKSIAKTTIVLFMVRLASMLISMVSVIVIAKFFGVSVERDCWILALTLTTTIVQALWGPLNETFRTKFVFIREKEGIEKAVSMTASLIGVIFVCTSLVSAIIWVFSEQIVSFLIGNIPSDSTGIFNILLISLIPSIVLTEFSKITTSILNALDIFYLPEIIGLFTGVFNLILVISLAPYIGIQSLVFSTYVSIVLLLAVEIYYLRKKNVHVWSKLLCFNIRDAAPFIIFSIPFFFPYLVGQINGILEKYIAALIGQGAVSSLDYSNQFIRVLQAILSGILTTVMVPMLAKAFAEKEISRFSGIFKDNLKICMLILIMTCGVLIGAANPICHFFFFRGKVDIEQLNVIIQLTRLYSLSFFGVFLYLIFGYSLLSFGKGRIYALLGVMTQIGIILLYLLGYSLTQSLYVFPIAVGLCHFFAALIMMCASKSFVSSEQRWSIVKSFLVLLCVSSILYGLNNLCPTDNLFIQIFQNGLVIIVLFLMVLRQLDYSVSSMLKQVKEKIGAFS